ncbi:uncharacterized protein LOC134238649 [Saccostrea cucullata]|uniref:uncharacterized protein LOC134238649 n=1 Tax=Saccostrea cuccullata TaxID=36930 RepID=UPI002ED13AD4
MGDEAAKNVVEPAYLCDEKKKDGFVHVIVSAKDLKTSRTLKGIKIIKKAENAEVNATFEERSFDLTVKGKDSGKLKLQVEDGRVILYLNKLENKSWYPELESGLETEEEEG